MKLSVLTYNILFNQARTILKELVDRYKPDIICLQEVETTDSNLSKLNIENYKFADFSNSFIQFNRVFGLVTFYNEQTLAYIDSKNFSLSRSFMETLLFILRGPKNYRSVLKTEFQIKNNQKKIISYNIHLTAFGSNGARNKQIKETFSDLDINSCEPTIITGDFNYPYGRKKFEKLIQKFDLKEATNELFFTQESRILGLFPIKLKLDYILYKNITSLDTIRIAKRNSDHYPILSVFEV